MSIVTAQATSGQVLTARTVLKIVYVEPVKTGSGLTIEVEKYPKEVEPGNIYTVTFYGELQQAGNVYADVYYTLTLSIPSQNKEKIVADGKDTWDPYVIKKKFTVVFTCPDFDLPPGTYDAKLEIELRYVPTAGKPPGVYPY